jgi:serine/threonine-protein kinase
MAGAAVSGRPLVGGKYALLARLGAGGMGEVWEARHAVTGRRVAVKLLRVTGPRQQEASRRFLREAQAIGRLEHPHVVEVLDAGIDPERQTPYIVQALLRGVGLRRYLRTRRRLSALEAASIVAPILRGLAAAHVAGIVHRDIKPSNVILCRQPDDPLDVVTPKIIDFGISKLEENEGETLSTLTASGVALGTVGYMAPEQIESRDIDGRADLWSVGVMLFEMVAGRRPFDGGSTAQTLIRSVSGEAPSLRSFDLALPEAFPDVVARALARDPADRFLSALDMLAALAGAVGAPLKGATLELPGASDAALLPPEEADATPEAAETEAAPPQAPPAPSRARSRAVFGLLAVGVAGLGIAAGLALGAARREQAGGTSTEAEPLAEGADASGRPIEPGAADASSGADAGVRVGPNGSVILGAE